MRNLFLTALLVLSANVAKADDIALGVPAYGGTGCPQGSVGVTLTEDQKVLSIIFDQFVAQAGAGSGLFIDRKACNLAIPIHVPQGLSVSVVKIDYRGYTYVPAGAQARFDVEYFLKSFNSNSKGPSASRVFNGPVDDNYIFTNNLLVSSTVWSACGEDVSLRVNTSLMARTNGKKYDVIATLDSADIAAGIIYKLQWRKCN